MLWPLPGWFCMAHADFLFLWPTSLHSATVFASPLSWESTPQLLAGSGGLPGCKLTTLLVDYHSTAIKGWCRHGYLENDYPGSLAVECFLNYPVMDLIAISKWNYYKSNVHGYIKQIMLSPWLDFQPLNGMVGCACASLGGHPLTLHSTYSWISKYYIS